MDKEKNSQDTRRITFTCITDVGNSRPQNEDNYLFFGNHMPLNHHSSEDVLIEEASESSSPFVCLFDGMGGELAGEVASYTAARYILKAEKPSEWDAETVKNIICDANRAVVMARKKLRITGTIGSTVLFLTFKNGECLIANVGDSPAFLFHDGEMEIITRAHTDAKWMEETGITGRKPSLTMYLGMDQDEYQFKPFITNRSVEDGDIVLLCSDGLTDMVNESEILEVLKSNQSLSGKTKQLRDMALQNGGEDNVTVILAQVHQ